jgi:hypothetical protein
MFVSSVEHQQSGHREGMFLKRIRDWLPILVRSVYEMNLLFDEQLLISVFYISDQIFS